MSEVDIEGLFSFFPIRIKKTQQKKKEDETEEKLETKEKLIPLTSGKCYSFAITGKLKSVKNRDQFILKISQSGSVFHPRVTKDTDYLILGELSNSDSAKLNLASKYKTKIISEYEAMYLLGIDNISYL